MEEKPTRPLAPLDIIIEMPGPNKYETFIGGLAIRPFAVVSRKCRGMYAWGMRDSAVERLFIDSGVQWAG